MAGEIKIKYTLKKRSSDKPETLLLSLKDIEEFGLEFTLNKAGFFKLEEESDSYDVLDRFVEFRHSDKADQAKTRVIPRPKGKPVGKRNFMEQINLPIVTYTVFPNTIDFPAEIKATLPEQYDVKSTTVNQAIRKALNELRIMDDWPENWKDCQVDWPGRTKAGHDKYLKRRGVEV